MKYLRSPSDSFDKFQKSDCSTGSTRSSIEEQMAKMKKMIKSPLSKRKHDGGAGLNMPKTFGVPLDELLQRNSESEIPFVLERITEYIMCFGTKQEGIFRVNGNAKVMEKLKLEFDKVGDADLENDGDVMSVAGLMKMFLRELPEPLIPRHFKKAFMQVYKEYNSDRSECCARMRNLAAELPEPRRTLLKFLCRFLVHISLHTDFNKMNANSLAIVFSPNMFRCSEGLDGFREQAVTNSIVRMFIEEYNLIFKDEHEETPSLSNFIQVQEAKDNSFTGPPAMPIPYEQHKKLKKRTEKQSSPLPETPEMIAPYAEYRVGEDHQLIIIDEPSTKLKVENHIYASVSKAQRDSILSSTWDPSSEEAEPYIRSNSPSWHKPNGEPSSPKMESSPKSRKEYMEKTIKESIKEHLFGHNLTSTSEESDKWDSPGEEAPPVPPKIPELLSPEDNTTRSQKRKKRRGSKSSQENARTSTGDDDLRDVTDTGTESDSRHKHKSDQDLDQSVVRSPKRQHRSKTIDMENREPLMINVVDYDSSERLPLKKDSFSSNTQDELRESVGLNLFAVGPSEVLSCLTRHRAPPPRRRRPPSLKRRKIGKIDIKACDSEVKTDLKQLPRKPPSPPPRPNLSPSNSISPAAASKIERRKQSRSVPELPKGSVERDVELDSEGGSCKSDSPTGDSPVLTLNLKRTECIPIVPPLELYKLCERSEDDPMVSPRERYDGGGTFDDAMISPRSRRDIRGFSSECPPSPPAKQENHFWMDKKPSTSPKGEHSLKELSKRAKSMKKKIKDFEEKFEEENGYKPTQSQDRAPIKKYVSELNRLQRSIQELKEKRLSAQAERSPVEATAQSFMPEEEKAPEPLLTTLPGTVEQSLENSLKKLKEKRELNGRPEDVDEMTRDQLQDEKLAVQKALLQHENAFGRPTTKRDKDIMKPLYDRYRTIKRKITNYSLKEFSNSPQSSKTKERSERRKTSPERPSELDMTSVSQVDTLGSTASEAVGRLAQSLPARTSRNLFDKDMSPVSPLTICVDEPGNSTIEVDDPGGGNDFPDGGGPLLTAKDADTKDPDAVLHQASTDELLEQQASALRRKKKLRKKLKVFEDNFTKKNGRKVQKEDRGTHEGDYEEYKKIKARLRLLDALITKQQGNNTI